MSKAQDEWMQRVLGLQVVGGSGASRMSPLLPTWLAAKEAAGAQISALQAAMRGLGHPVFERIADQGLHGITGRLQVGLQVALTELDRGGDAAGPARQKARTAAADLRAFLAGDPVLPLLESNPLGVKVSLRADLARALDAIETALAA